LFLISFSVQHDDRHADIQSMTAIMLAVKRNGTLFAILWINPARWQEFKMTCIMMNDYLQETSREQMGYSATDTAQKHERILDESIRLFRERGFHGVSVSEVMKAAGLTHGPFYNHFASKEALMSETLTRELQRSIGDFDKLPATETGKAAFADYYLSEEHMQDCSGGCAVAALSSEIRQEKDVRGNFTAQIKNVIQKLASYFPWKSRRSARGDAIHWYASMIGALILARAVDDKEFAREILAETRKRIS
jgi:TetR/AcrR family transcriptional repressor of nem operon